MPKKPESDRNTVTALKVHQWMPAWNEVRWDSAQGQAKPTKEYFLMFSMKASHLKALTGVHRRSVKGGRARALDPNVQRGHEEERSHLIREFVQHGFPLCEMSETKRKQPDAGDLRKPGWLPTAILVNILPSKARRNGKQIPSEDLIEVEDRDSTVLLHLPETFSGAKWEPQEIFPIEVIDGQHRLWAFEDSEVHDDFELPVVAFTDLDRGWQAYLFWSVNITPKKINRSLAFDLYPLLRQQTWLDKFAGHSIYRETRCQELVEALWSNPESPWHLRINMLGETKENREYKGPSATQAAWVRSLMQTLVKQWEGTSKRIGGLFGPPMSAHDLVLPWNRAMQAAVLIYAGNSLKHQIKSSTAEWAKYLRKVKGQEDLFDGDDPAFYGNYSLLSTDQGIRGFLFIINDLCFVSSEELHLAEWRWEERSARKTASATEVDSVLIAIKSFSKSPAAEFIDSIAKVLAKYDWRTSSTPDISEEIRIRQGVFRGSSGYKEMRMRLLDQLESSTGQVGKAAKLVKKALGYS
ncbi:MAG: DGQHR domain-containing protein [Steroidobacter sp.]